LHSTKGGVEMGVPPIRWIKTKIIVSEIEQILEEILERDRCFNSYRISNVA
jgi:hypothetical protein